MKVGRLLNCCRESNTGTHRNNMYNCISMGSFNIGYNYNRVICPERANSVLSSDEYYLNGIHILHCYSFNSKFKMTYSAAGVSIDCGNELVEKIKPLARSTSRSGCFGDLDLGGFGGLFDLKAIGYQDPILVSGTDGVGTKLKVFRRRLWSYCSFISKSLSDQSAIYKRVQICKGDVTCSQ